MEDERRWEDLNTDCLVKIFERVGVESLILDLPFVCKSWYEATLNPLCWRSLVFPQINPDPWLFDDDFDPFQDRFVQAYHLREEDFSITGFIKLIVRRSCKLAIEVRFPDCCISQEAFDYVSDECPCLKTLVLPRGVVQELQFHTPKVIGKWKDLEILKLGYYPYSFQEILAQISIHCKNFVGLYTEPFSGFDIGNEQAEAIVTLLPNIKYLRLRGASLPRENLEMILKSCKELAHLDVRDCIGFEADDDEILIMGSHINKFQFEGSRMYDDDYDYVDPYEDANYMPPDEYYDWLKDDYVDHVEDDYNYDRAGNMWWWEKEGLVD